MFSKQKRYRVKWDWRRGVKNAAQVFLIGYVVIGILLFMLAVREMGWSDTLAVIDADAVTAPELWLLPALVALVIGFVRSRVEPTIDVTDMKQLSAYIEANRFRHWPRWQKVVLIGFLGLMLSLPFWPATLVSDEPMRWIESETAELADPSLSKLFAEIVADGVVNGAEFSRFMSKSIEVRAVRFTHRARDVQMRHLFGMPDQEI